MGDERPPPWIQDYLGPMPAPATPDGNSPEDREMLQRIGKKYAPLRSLMETSTVSQSRDPGDGRQLEYYHPKQGDNPNPGKSTFELYQPFQGQEREDAVAADALHELGGLNGGDSGEPVDPAWRAMRDQLWNMRTPGQQRIDQGAYAEEQEPGDTPDKWADRNRKDAYVRAGMFPERNPDWDRGEGDPESWTPEQRAHFARMKSYLGSGLDPLTAATGARRK